METKTHFVNTRILSEAHDHVLEALSMVEELEVIAPSNTSVDSNLRAAIDCLERTSQFLVWARINNRIKE